MMAPAVHPSAHQGAAAMTEAELDRHVRSIAKQLGLRVYHTWDSRNSGAGWPDMVIAGPNGVLFRELKRGAGKLTADQLWWLDTLHTFGLDTSVWRPGDLVSGEIAAQLTAVSGYGKAMRKAE